MTTKQKNNNFGTSIVGLLGVAFIILKLCKVIAWSWWWVLLPFWGGISIVLIGFSLFIIYSVFRIRIRR